MPPTEEQRAAAQAVREYLADKVSKLMREGKMDLARRQFGLPVTEVLDEIEKSEG